MKTYLEALNEWRADTRAAMTEAPEDARCARCADNDWTPAVCVDGDLPVCMTHYLSVHGDQIETTAEVVAENYCLLLDERPLPTLREVEDWQAVCRREFSNFGELISPLDRYHPIDQIMYETVRGIIDHLLRNEHDAQTEREQRAALDEECEQNEEELRLWLAGE